jgi:hypothetical protein
VGLTIHTQRVAMQLESQNGISQQTAIVAENRGEPIAPTLQITPEQAEESRNPASPSAKKPAQSPAPASSGSAPLYGGMQVPRSEAIRSTPASAFPPPPEPAPATPPPPAAAQAAPPPPAAPAPEEATDRATAESGAAPGENSGAAGGAPSAAPASAPAEDRFSSTNAPASGGAAPVAPASAPAENHAAASHVRREEGVLFQKNADAQTEATEEKVAVGNAPGYFSAKSPDGQTQWRFGHRGLIERTTNASAATAEQVWTREISPLHADLLAGSAPSPTVCWIVGSDGAILRTTDGATWQAIPSPASAARNGVSPDWVAVSARDANNATITSADNRTFTTTDAGHTWQPQ